jgi:type I restriction enzyme, S subunit
MNKEIKKLIPDLRFPEFVNEGEWKEKNLGSICDVTNGKANVQDHVEGGKFPLFDRSEVIKATNNYIFDCEAVIIPGEGMRFVPKYYKGKFNLHQRAYALKDFTCDGQFVYFSMLHRSNLLSQKAVQSTVLSLRLPILQKFPIEIPKNPNEQQKIASCLSSLDEVIAAHSQKLELLKDHKKGLMQNLFPQEGEKVPKYRFKEFVNDGEWVEKTLNEVATFLKGKGISKADIVEKGSLPCIRYGELYTHYNETISIIKSYTNLSADELVLSQTNDVIIPASGETQIDIATASCVLEKGIALGGDLNIIRTKINGVFLSYYLNNVKRMDIAQMAQGISVIHLYPNQLKTLIINTPKPKEQQKIASCFSSLDALITAQAEKIEQLKLHKKGLMQGLFPKVNE